MMILKHYRMPYELFCVNLNKKSTGGLNLVQENRPYIIL